MSRALTVSIDHAGPKDALKDRVDLKLLENFAVVINRLGEAVSRTCSHLSGTKMPKTRLILQTRLALKSRLACTVSSVCHLW